MRVIGGLAGGRRLRGPPDRWTRPMTDRAREGLFSIIAPLLPDADVLDLYAGTGSLGLEALSRGAATAVFVERRGPVLRVLRKNVEAVGLGGRVVAADVRRFLPAMPDGRPPGRGDPGVYDLVFMDPPYRDSLASVESMLACATPLLRVGGAAILHRHSGERRPEAPGLSPVADHTYGTARIWRFRRATPAGGPAEGPRVPSGALRRERPPEGR